MSTPELVYIVSTYGTGVSGRELRNAVEDYNGNMVCWTSRENAQKWIENNGFEDRMIPVQRRLEELLVECKTHNTQYGTVGSVRVVKRVEFD